MSQIRQVARERVLDALQKWDRKADDRCAAASRVSVALALAGGLGGLLSGWSAAAAILSAPQGVRAVLAVAAAACGAVIAVASAINAQHRPEQRWARARALCDTLQAELDQFDLGRGKYGGDDADGASALLAMLAEAVKAARDLPR